MVTKFKSLFYINHMMLMSTVSKVRLVLTSIGIFVSVFLYSLGLIITSSYYEGSLKFVDDMADNTAIVTSSKSSFAVKKEISKATGVYPTEVAVLPETKSILSTKIEDNQYLNVMATIQGTSGTDKCVSVILDNGTFIPVESVLIKGRNISQSDIQSNAKVVVIDEFTESLLFPNGDGIGKTVELGVGINGSTVAAEGEEAVSEAFEVIGVVKSSYLSDTRNVSLKKELDKNSGNIFVNTSIYCPISTLKELSGDVDIEEYYLCFFEDSESYQAFNGVMTTLSEVSERKNEIYTVSTKDSLREEVEQDLSYTKTLLNIISLVLCIISGAGIMSVVFLSVKERIPEIGIRKALGASKLDIIFQFIFEMVFIAFFVSVFSVCISFYVCKLAEGYLASQLFMSFTVSVSTEQLLLPIFVGVLETVICSIIPSLYACTIKVTDSLRFE